MILARAAALPASTQPAWRPEVGFEPLAVTEAAGAATAAVRARFGRLVGVPLDDITAVACEALVRALGDGINAPYVLRHLVRHYETRRTRSRHVRRRQQRLTRWPRP